MVRIWSPNIPQGVKKDSNRVWCKTTQNDGFPIDFMIFKAILKGKLPFEMRFGRFGTKTMKFYVNLEGFLAIDIFIFHFV